MKCPNCGKKEFIEMPLFESNVLATSGRITQLVNSFVCLHCGRVELYMSAELINKKIEQEQMRLERLQKEEIRKQEEQRLRDRMHELETILKDENRTLKELKEAQKELSEIQEKLQIKFRTVYFKV